MILSLKRHFQEFDLIRDVTKLITHPHISASMPRVLAGLYGKSAWHPPLKLAFRSSSLPATTIFCAYSLKQTHISIYLIASDVWQICMADKRKTPAER